MNDEQKALQPPLPLLNKVHQGERTLLVHLAIHKVERVSPARGQHRKETILRNGSVDAVIKSDSPFCGHLKERSE